MRVDGKWMAIPAFLCAAFLGLAATPGYAQDDKTIHVNIAGGPTFIFGDLGSRFNMGWGPAFGVTVEANPKVAFQFEYAFRWFNVDDDLPIGATRFDANHQTHQMAFNLVLSLASEGFRPYFIVGPGFYYRKVEITEYVGTGIICDPWYYVCGAYPIEAIIGSRGGWDFGFNVGGGVGFPLGDGGAEFYVETRYHWVAGPEITPTVPVPIEAGTGGDATGQYLPVSFGFRF